MSHSTHEPTARKVTFRAWRSAAIRHKLARTRLPAPKGASPTTPRQVPTAPSLGNTAKAPNELRPGATSSGSRSKDPLPDSTARYNQPGEQQKCQTNSPSEAPPFPAAEARIRCRIRERGTTSPENSKSAKRTPFAGVPILRQRPQSRRSVRPRTMNCKGSRAAPLHTEAAARFKTKPGQL